MKETKKVKINGKVYKHISSFGVSRNTLKQRILNRRRIGKKLVGVIKIHGGYYLTNSSPILQKCKKYIEENNNAISVESEDELRDQENNEK